MPVTNIFGHTTPRVGSGPQDSDGPRNIQKAFDDYSASLHPTVVVDTVHEIAPLAGRLPPGSFPVFFWVRGERATYCVPERGAAAQWYAGGAYIWDSPLEELKLPNGTWTQTSPAAPRAATPGFQAKQGALVLPADGMYAIHTQIGLTTTAQATTRFLIEIRAGAANVSRASAVNENNLSNIYLGWFPKGTEISVWVYQTHNQSHDSYLKSGWNHVRVALLGTVA
ncbi:hypothetical protein ACX3T3_05400 [Actinotignum schaalii]|uniref:hypothetical protein n=1 Tax=Actinotignum TaxID=1653174 RepID=UPI00237D88F3|nr:hypothetical protein [Actinotignum sanguinis]MDE1552213.1 hypothetical protein [Actinotignum sanguinis]